MAAQKTITGRVTRVERTGHTIYGNPIKLIAIELTSKFVNAYNVWDAGDVLIFRISDNASMVYEIENQEFRNEPHTFAVTRASRISHVIRER